MKVLITYDISQRHEEVKKALLEAGLRDRWTGNGMTYYLPETTVWHNNLDNATAGSQLVQDTIRALNEGQPEDRIIDVQRVMAVIFTNWAGNRGEPHSDE